MRLANGLGSSLRKTDIPDLTDLHEARQRAHRLLHRGLGIHSVLGVNVNRVNTQPFEARLTRAHDMVGTTIDAPLPIGIATKQILY